MLHSTRSYLLLIALMLVSGMAIAQKDVPHRDWQLVDSTNSGRVTPLIPTVDKAGYAHISKANGKYYHQHLASYLTDSLGVLTNQSDSVYISGDSICVISVGDTLCVGQDSSYVTDSTLCIIQMGDTTCISYDGEGGNHYFNADLTQTGNRTHDGNGYNVTLNDAGGHTIHSTGEGGEIRLDRTPNGGTTLSKMRLSDSGADFAYDQGAISSSIIIDATEAGLYHSTGEYSIGGFFYPPGYDHSIVNMLGLNSSGRLRQSRALVPADTSDLVATHYDLSILGGGSDSFYIVNDSVCAISMGDTLCVSQDSFYITDSTICVIQLGDTTCVDYSSGSGNIYSINGTITGGQTRFVDIPYNSNLNFRKSNGDGNPFSTLRIGEGTNGSRMLKIENWSVSTEAPTITMSNLNTGNIYQFYQGHVTGQDYSTGVNRSASSYVLGAGDDLADPYISLYGAEDSIFISKNARLSVDNQPSAFEVFAFGANAGSTQTTHAGYYSNTRTGTSSTNYGLYSIASGATLNYGVYANGTHYGLYGTGNVTAIWGVGGGYGVRGEGSTAGVYGIGTTAFGVFGTCTTGTPLVGSVSAGSSNAPTTMMRLIKSTTLTPLDGIGAQIDFDIETSTSSDIANRIRSRWSTVAHASRTSQMSIVGVDNASEGEIIYFEGDKRTRFNGRAEQKQGVDVASTAGALTLGGDGNAFEITGTNSITLISNIGWQNGSIINLIFTSTATLQNGVATSGTDITIRLASASNFSATADDIITLMLCEVGGVQAWREVSRSVN